MPARPFVSARHARSDDGVPWRRAKDGLVLRVCVTPKSSRHRIDGCGQQADGPALLARINAVPEDGAVNDALEALVAAWLGVPKRAVTLTQGAKSRVKSLSISGDADMLEARLAACLAALTSSDQAEKT